MGTNQSVAGANEGEGSSDRDSYYLNLTLGSVFNETFADKLYESLPNYDSTIIEGDEKNIKDKKKYTEIGKEADEFVGDYEMELYQDIQSVFSKGKTRFKVKDFTHLMKISEHKKANKQFYNSSKKRLRLITRIHHAFLRVNGLTESGTSSTSEKSSGKQKAQYLNAASANESGKAGPSSASDVMTGLATSMCVGIATSTMTENPAIFPAMAKSIIHLLESVPVETLSMSGSNASPVLARTLQQIEEFAKNILENEDSGIHSSTREEALSILLAVAYATGSLKRLLDVIGYVYSYDGSTKTSVLLSDSANFFLNKLRGWKIDHAMDVIDPTNSIESISIAATIPKETMQNVSTLSADRESLYLWNEEEHTLYRVSNGFFGSVSGGILVSNGKLQDQIQSMFGIKSDSSLSLHPPSKKKEEQNNDNKDDKEVKTVTKNITARLAVVGSQLYVSCEEYLGVDCLAVVNKDTLTLENIVNLGKDTTDSERNSALPPSLSVSPGTLALQVPSPVVEYKFSCKANQVIFLNAFPGFELQRCKFATLEGTDVTKLVTAKITDSRLGDDASGSNSTVFYVSNIVQSFGAVSTPDADFTAIFEFSEENVAQSISDSVRQLPIVASSGGQELLTLQMRSSKEKKSSTTSTNKSKGKNGSTEAEISYIPCAFSPFDDIELISLKTEEQKNVDLTEFRKLWKTENEYNTSVFAEHFITLSTRSAKDTLIDSHLTYKIKGKDGTFLYSYCSQTHGRELSKPRKEKKQKSSEGAEIIYPTLVDDSIEGQNSPNSDLESRNNSLLLRDDDDDDDDDEDLDDEDDDDDDEDEDEDEDDDDDDDSLRSDSSRHYLDLNNRRRPGRASSSEPAQKSPSIKTIFPSVSGLVNNAIPHLLGQHTSLEAVVMRTCSKGVKTSRKFTIDLPKTLTYLLFPGQIENQISICWNGEELVLHEVKHGLSDAIKAGKKSFVVTSHKFGCNGKWIETKVNSFPLSSTFGVPQAICYDVHNNLIWGHSPSWHMLTRWRNSGVAPVVYTKIEDDADETYASDPATRLNALLAIDKQSNAAQIQAASLLTMIDNIGADHSISYDSPPADLELSNSISVMSRGSVNSNGGSDGFCRIEVRGHIVLDIPDIDKMPHHDRNRHNNSVPTFNSSRGIYIVTLNERLDAVDWKFFGTYAIPKTDEGEYDSDDSDAPRDRNKKIMSHGPEMEAIGNEMAEFLENQPSGRIVLITSTYNANSSYFPIRLADALESVGVPAEDAKKVTKANTMNDGTSLCLIGYKGAKAGSVQSYFGNGSKVVIQRTRLGPSHISLCVQPDKNTLRKLIDMCCAMKESMLKSGVDGCKYSLSALLATLNILSTNLFHISRGSTVKSLTSIVGRTHRMKLRHLITSLLVIKACSLPNKKAHNALCVAVGNTFNTSMSVLYPKPKDKVKILIQLVEQYAAGDLAHQELGILNQVLIQSADPKAISELFHDIIPQNNDEDSDTESDKSDVENEEEDNSVDIFPIIDSVLKAVKLNFKDTVSAIVAPHETEVEHPVLLSGTVVSQFINALATGITNAAIHLMGEDSSPSRTVPKPDSTPSLARTSSAMSNGPIKGLAMYVDLLKLVVNFGKEMSSIAISANKVLGNKDIMDSKIDYHLKNSPIQSLLPTLLLAMSGISETHGSKLLSNSGNEVLQQMYELASLLKECESMVSSLLRYVPGDEQVTGVVSPPQLKKTYKSFESPHEYLPNMNVHEVVNCPGAHKIVITFDSRTRTETGCDIVRFYDSDDAELSHWHGRGSDRRFPGLDNQPPLEITGNSFGFRFITDSSGQDWGYKMDVEIHTMVQVNSIKMHWLRVLDQELSHCLTYLAKKLIESTPIQKGLEEGNEAVITNKIINPDLFLLGKEGQTEEDKLLFGLINPEENYLSARFIADMKRLVPEDQGNEEHINRAIYSTCAAIIKCNGLSNEALAVAKSHVNDEPAKRLRPSDRLIKAWRAGQNMRKFFQLAELRAAVVPQKDGAAADNSGGGTSRRAIGLYDGADSTVTEAASNIVVNKARFLLLTIAGGEDIDASTGEKDLVSQVQSRAKSNWVLLRKAMISTASTSEGPSTRPPSLMRADSAPIPVKRSQFFNVVKSAVAADRLKNMISFRRRWAESHKSGQSTLTENVLALMQNHIDILELQRLHDVRTQRVQSRALGLRLLAVRLELIMLRVDELPSGEKGRIDRERMLFNISSVMISFSEALRSCAAVATSSDSEQIHIKKSAGGAPYVLLSAMDTNLGQFLCGATRALNFCFEQYCAELGDVKGRWKAAVVLALCTFAYDYQYSDHALLGACGIVPALFSILSKLDEAPTQDNRPIHLRAKQLLSLIATRCPGSDLFATNGPTNLTKLLLRQLSLEVHRRGLQSRELATTPFLEQKSGLPPLDDQLRVMAPARRGSSTNTNFSVIPQELSYSVVENIIPLRGAYSACSYVFQHVDDDLNHSFTLWLKRDSSLIESKLDKDKKRDDKSLEKEIEAQFTVGTNVMRGCEEEWTKTDGETSKRENNDDGGVGGIGTIADIVQSADNSGNDSENSTLYIVKWSRTNVSKKYTIRQLALASVDIGGHIFSKGAPPLMDISVPEGKNTGVMPPWSVYGLTLLPNGALASFASKGIKVKDGEDPDLQFETIRCSRQLPADEWVHVTSVQDGAKATLSFKGATCEEKVEHEFSAAMTIFQTAIESSIEIESPHPYLDNTDIRQVIEEEGAEGYVITFSENSRTEHDYDWCKFLKGDGNNEESHWGNRYSGSKFPGMNGNEPLVIDSPKFCFRFHSDGSGHDWGYKINVEVTRSEDFVKQIAKNQESNKPKYLNEMSLYVGQRPYYAGNSHIPTDPGFKGCIAALRMYPRTALNDKQTAFLENNSPARHISQAAVALNVPSEHGLLHTLSVLSKGISNIVNADPVFLNEALEGNAISLLNSLFLLAQFSDSMLIKDVSWALCTRIVPYLDPNLVGGQARNVGLCLAEEDDATTAFILYLLRNIGRNSCFSAAVDGSCMIPDEENQFNTALNLRPSRDITYGVTLRKLDLLSQIAASSNTEWRSVLAHVVNEVASDIPRLFSQLRQLQAVQEASIFPSGNNGSQLVKSDKEALYCTYGLIAFFGGTFSTLHPGAQAMYVREGSISEECCVLGQFYVPGVLPKPNSNRRSSNSQEDPAEERRKFWKGLSNFGEACIISVASNGVGSDDDDVLRPLLVPRRNLKLKEIGSASSEPFALSDFILKDLGKKCVIDVMHAIVNLDTQDRRPKPQSLPFKLRDTDDLAIMKEEKKKSSKSKVMDFTRVYRSLNHSPYDTVDAPEPILTRVSIPGAMKMKVQFDQKFSLKANHCLRVRSVKSNTVINTYYGQGVNMSKIDKTDCANDPIILGEQVVAAACAPKAEPNEEYTNKSRYEENKQDAPNYKTSLEFVVSGDEAHLELITLEPGQYSESSGVSSPWGWSLKVTASIEEGVNISPPPLPVLPVLGLVSHLKMLGMRAVNSFLSASNPSLKDGQGDWFVREAISFLSSPLVRSCLTPITCLGSNTEGFQMRSKTLQFESPHPYKRRQDTVTPIHIKGAKSLILRFDNRTKTESGADYIKFYADSKCNNQIPGTSSYSGGMNGGHQNFPGCYGNPVLEIEGNTCYMTFHSDGSVEDWGYLLYVKAKIDQGTQNSGNDIENPLVNAKMGHENASLAVYTMQNLFADGPKMKGNTLEMLSSGDSSLSAVNSLRFDCYPHIKSPERGPEFVEIVSPTSELNGKLVNKAPIQENRPLKKSGDREAWPIGYSIEVRPSVKSTAGGAHPERTETELKMYSTQSRESESSVISSSDYRLLAFSQSDDQNWVKVRAIPIPHSAVSYEGKQAIDEPQFARFDERRLPNEEIFSCLEQKFCERACPVHLSLDKEVVFTSIPTGFTTFLEGQHSAVGLHSDTGFNLSDISSAETTGNYVEFTLLECPSTEITADDNSRPFIVSVGLAFADKDVTIDKKAPLNPSSELQIMAYFCGWAFGTYAYHSDDSSRWGHQSRSNASSANATQFMGEGSCHGYGKGDTIGVGVDFESRRIFYTKNGVKLTSQAGDLLEDRSDNISLEAFKEFVTEKGKLLYPTLCFDSEPHFAAIEMNSGQRPFVYQPAASSGIVKLSTAAKAIRGGTEWGSPITSSEASSMVEFEGWVDLQENPLATLVRDDSVPGSTRETDYAPIISTSEGDFVDRSTTFKDWSKEYGKYDVSDSVISRIPMTFGSGRGALVDMYGDIAAAGTGRYSYNKSSPAKVLPDSDAKTVDETEAALIGDGSKPVWANEKHPMFYCADKVAGIDDKGGSGDDVEEDLDQVLVMRAQPRPSNKSKGPNFDQYIERCVLQFSSIAIYSYSTDCLFRLLSAWPADLPFSIDAFASGDQEDEGINHFMSIVALGLKMGKLEAIRLRFLNLIESEKEKNSDKYSIDVTQKLVKFAVEQLSQEGDEKGGKLKKESISNSLRTNAVAKVIETRHPYNVTPHTTCPWPPLPKPCGKLTSQKWSVSIPEAKYLLVTFDENCCTSVSDSLAIYTGADHSNPDIVFSGRRLGSWPFLREGVKPLRIDATSAYFEFTTSDRATIGGNDTGSAEILSMSADSLRAAGVDVDDKRYCLDHSNGVAMGGGFTCSTLVASVAGPKAALRDTPATPLVVPYWGIKIVVYGIMEEPDNEELVPTVVKAKPHRHLSCWILDNLVTLPPRKFPSIQAQVFDPRVVDALWKYLGVCAGSGNGPKLNKSDYNNAAGFEMKKSPTVGEEGYYCGRHLGVDCIPRSDGQCGPTNGPMCSDCKTGFEKLQAKSKAAQGELNTERLIDASRTLGVMISQLPDFFRHKLSMIETFSDTRELCDWSYTHGSNLLNKISSLAHSLGRVVTKLKGVEEKGENTGVLLSRVTQILSELALSARRSRDSSGEIYARLVQKLAKAEDDLREKKSGEVPLLADAGGKDVEEIRKWLEPLRSMHDSLSSMDTFHRVPQSIVHGFYLPQCSNILSQTWQLDSLVGQFPKKTIEIPGSYGLLLKLDPPNLDLGINQELVIWENVEGNGNGHHNRQDCEVLRLSSKAIEAARDFMFKPGKRILDIKNKEKDEDESQQTTVDPLAARKRLFHMISRATVAGGGAAGLLRVEHGSPPIEIPMSGNLNAQPCIARAESNTIGLGALFRSYTEVDEEHIASADKATEGPEIENSTNLTVGAKVTRGPKWNRFPHDDGLGSVGTVVELGSWAQLVGKTNENGDAEFLNAGNQPYNAVRVVWSKGTEDNVTSSGIWYRYGYEGKYDLKLLLDKDEHKKDSRKQAAAAVLSKNNETEEANVNKMSLEKQLALLKERLVADAGIICLHGNRVTIEIRETSEKSDPISSERMMPLSIDVYPLLLPEETLKRANNKAESEIDKEISEVWTRVKATFGAGNTATDAALAAHIRARARSEKYKSNNFLTATYSHFEPTDQELQQSPHLNTLWQMQKPVKAEEESDKKEGADSSAELADEDILSKIDRSEGWSCAACTFINTGTENKCKMCGREGEGDPWIEMQRRLLEEQSNTGEMLDYGTLGDNEKCCPLPQLLWDLTEKSTKMDVHCPQWSRLIQMFASVRITEREKISTEYNLRKNQDCGSVSDPVAQVRHSTYGEWPLSPIAARFYILQDLNNLFMGCLNQIDISECANPSILNALNGDDKEAGVPKTKFVDRNALPRLFNKHRSLFVPALKDSFWNNAMATTTSRASEFNLAISRSKARKYMDLGEVDTEGRWTTFAQAFRVLYPMDPAKLRHGDKVYSVQLAGEFADDYGGPYRESFEGYCVEVQSTSMSLMCQTPNGRHITGNNREKWILNPNAVSRTELKMLAFLGKLMGNAIRSRNYLNLNIPLFIWKLIAGELPTLQDLEDIDQPVVRNFLYDFRHIDETMDEATFNVSFYETFTTISADGKSVKELVHGGADKAVTFENRHEYCDLVENFRLHEFDKQAAAVRAGLGTVVPVTALNLHSGEDLEKLVCGSPEIDLTLLKSCTEYRSCRSDSKHVQYFWQAMESFSTEERQAFIRFVWGRSRLPLTAGGFSSQFRIQGFDQSPADSYFPVAHTCFFSLELPAYSTLNIMKQKLLYAIFNCVAIDGDDTGAGVNAANMGWEE